MKAFFVVYRFRITLVAGKGRERKKGALSPQRPACRVQRMAVHFSGSSG